MAQIEIIWCFLGLWLAQGHQVNELHQAYSAGRGTNPRPALGFQVEGMRLAESCRADRFKASVLLKCGWRNTVRLLGIPEVTIATPGKLGLKVEGATALAKPAHDARRVTAHECMGRYIVEHARLRIDQRKSANDTAGANQRPWPNVDAFL